MASFTDYLRLMRISLLPTAWSNVLAGFALSALPAPTSNQWIALSFLLLSSGSLYLCGMAMNDLFDFELDCKERPERVLPTGKISIAAAKKLVVVLALSGLLFATIAGILSGNNWMPTITAVVLLGLIVLYNAQAKGTAYGPLVMGSCRSANLLLGCTLVDSTTLATGFDGAQLIVAACLGLYVAGITLLATDEHRAEAKRFLWPGMLIIMTSFMAIGWFAHTDLFTNSFHARHGADPGTQHRLLFTGLLAMMAMPVIRNLLVAVTGQGSVQVKRAVVTSLLTIIVIDASICYLVSPTTPAYALITASLMIPAFLMTRQILAT